MRKLLLSVVIIAALLSMAGCKKTSPYSDDAKMRAMKAAYELLQVDPTDTFAMQQCIVKAGAVRSRYELMGDTLAVADFNRAYQATIEKRNPRLAKDIFK